MKNVFRMRCSNAAHPDMRRVMPLRDEFRRRASTSKSTVTKRFRGSFHIEPEGIVTATHDLWC